MRSWGKRGKSGIEDVHADFVWEDDFCLVDTIDALSHVVAVPYSPITRKAE